jgi:pimeloyl-[acyl-carrier protein] methyl ester esterase
MRRKFTRDPEAALHDFHTLCASPHTDRDEIARRVSASRSLDFEAMTAGLADLESLDARAVLTSLSVPVLMLHGARDRVIPVEAASATAKRLARCHLHIHPSAEHDLPLQDPFWIVQHIREFLASLRG